MDTVGIFLIGIIVGTIAGVLSHHLFDWTKNWFNKKSRLKRAIWEIEYIIGEINSYKTINQRLQNYIGRNDIGSFDKFFPFHSVIYPTLHIMFNSGELTDYLGKDQIGRDLMRQLVRMSTSYTPIRQQQTLEYIVRMKMENNLEMAKTLAYLFDAEFDADLGHFERIKERLNTFL